MSIHRLPPPMSRTGSDRKLGGGRTRMNKQLSSPQLKAQNINDAHPPMSPKQRAKRPVQAVRKANPWSGPVSPLQRPKKRIPGRLDELQVTALGNVHGGNNARSPVQRPKQPVVDGSGRSVVGPPPVRRGMPPLEQHKASSCPSLGPENGTTPASPLMKKQSSTRRTKDSYPVLTSRPMNLQTPWSQSSPHHRHASCLAPSGDRLAELCRQGYPLGLAQELKLSQRAYPVRFWVIDNSESMGEADGHNARGLMSCSRFSELQGAVKYHARLAGILRATTIFRMVNDPSTSDLCIPQEFSVADLTTRTTIEDDVRNASAILRQCEPMGDTPLTQQMQIVLNRIRQIAPDLQKEGHKAVVVVATDGMPTDKNGKTTWAARRAFVQTLRAMKKLPVWIVLRLCTDDSQIVKFYNGLDSIYNLPLEVIDDFIGEAKEIQKANPWLTYSQPLHRCREMGYHHRVFDLLDERLLSMDELYEFVNLLFGREAMHQAPHPKDDWSGFTRVLHEVVRAEGMALNPITRSEMHWIDMEELEKCYTKRSGFRLFRRN